jgi:type IV pilus assembly protein PilB
MNHPAQKKNPGNLKLAAQRRSSLKSTILDQSGAGKTKIGEILCKEGYITRTHLDDALNFQKKNNGKLGSILIRLGYIDENTIVNVLSRLQNYPSVSISKITPPTEVLEILPYTIAKKYLAFPLKIKNDELYVTMAEPTDTAAVDALRQEVRMSLQISVSTEKDIVEAYKTYYQISDEQYESYFRAKNEVKEEDHPVTLVDDFGSLVSEAVVEMEAATTREEAIEKEAYTAADAPIIKLVNGIFIKAVKEGVSDIHIEPFEKSLQVRYRLDGSLFKSMNLPATIKNALISRIKILAGLNIAERRIPQDGRIKMRIGNRQTVDFRVSTLPTLYGESIVTRILDPSSLNVNISKLGFEPIAIETLERCIYRPYGLNLVTGPTGSGKTTTLYSVLNLLNKEDVKILTAEDPVEFNFKGINQVHVNDQVGMTFAAALKAFLRQDPDIIMVGEIRDIETAEIAIKAAMTGHLVFSTLHTNDCPSTIGRLRDIGIPAYMLASAVTMVLSQRLARKLCANCKEVDENASSEKLLSMGFLEEEIRDLAIYGPKGCSSCKGTGYKGRAGLYEIMEINAGVQKVINAGSSEDILREEAIKTGMMTLRDSGLEKIRQGVTSIEEVEKRTVVRKNSLSAGAIDHQVEFYEEKSAVFRENENNPDFFMLVQGTLYVMKNGKKIAEIANPGEYFGVDAAITRNPHTTTVIAKTAAKIKRFPGKNFNEIIDSRPDIRKQIFEMNSRRIDRAEKIIVKLLNDAKK